MYRSLTRRPVTCEFAAAEFMDEVKAALGKRVVVFGVLKKNANGDTLRIKMDRIQVLGESQDNFLADITGLPDPQFSVGVSTDEYLRNIRE